MVSSVFDNIQQSGLYTAPPTVSAHTDQKQVKQTVSATAVNDSVELQNTTSKKEKKGIIKSTKNFIANFKKFFSTAGTYIGGTLKGLVTGAGIGSLVYTGGEIFNHFKKDGAKLFKSKPIAIVAAGIALAGSLWNASLDATEKQSDIEHRYIGH